MDPATIENLNHEWSPQDLSKTRKLKIILPQFYAALAIFAVNLTHSIFESNIYHFTLSMDIELTALGTYDWMTCIGLLVGGIAAQMTGARVIVIFAGVVSTAGWITVLGWISANAVLKWIFYIVLFAKGMMQAPSYVYLAEISQPNMRSTLIAVMCLSENIGMISMNLPNTVSTKIIASANVVCALVGLVVMFFLPDSPYRLANRGCYYAAESSLAWFRGRTTIENAKTESNAINSNAQISPTACKLFGQKSLYIAALTVGYAFLVTAFVRIFAITYFSHAQLELMYLKDIEIRNPIFLAFAIYTIFLSIAFVVLVAIVGKRLMITLSLFSGSMAMLVASIVGFLSASAMSTETYYWLHLICAAVAQFSLITGVVPVPLMLNAELFPSKLRNVGAGSGLFFAHTVLVVSDQFLFDYLFTRPSALLTFALATVFGLISLVWLFPKNDNKSLVEIEHNPTDLYTSMKKKSFCNTFISRLITCKP